MTPPRGWALAAQPASGYRRAWVRERMADSFWPVPALLLVVGVVLAGVTARAPSLGLDGLLRVGPQVSAGETSNVLGIIASSTLTFLGVVFTLTLVALQLASSQLSPRVVRMFVRSGVTKLAFGLLLAAFSYCVAFLVLEGGSHRADSAGLTVAISLVTASLIVFLGYVATTMRLLQVAWVITRVADETRASITANTPPADKYLRAAPSSPRTRSWSPWGASAARRRACARACSRAWIIAGWSGWPLGTTACWSCWSGSASTSRPAPRSSPCTRARASGPSTVPQAGQAPHDPGLMDPRRAPAWLGVAVSRCGGPRWVTCALRVPPGRGQRRCR